jgi:hypothetical protein
MEGFVGMSDTGIHSTPTLNLMNPELMPNFAQGYAGMSH